MPSAPVTTPVTVVIPTLNEATQIAECVRHLTWAGEVIVADGGSTDETVAAARAAGATVLTGAFATIAAQRNAAIAAARHEWVFALDADERVPAALAGEIAATVAAPQFASYGVRRRNVYLGREMRHAGWGSDWVYRLFRREQRFTERRVHEALRRAGASGRLRAPLDHVPYRDLGHHLRKVERYAALAALDLRERGRRARLSDLLVRPPVRFVRMYVGQLGLLEGWRGAVLCGFAALGVFLKYARLWEHERGSHA
jgi:glycosyltransferase involved in cell wall biosynthesis